MYLFASLQFRSILLCYRKRSLWVFSFLVSQQHENA
jgi:hypothetical protein